MPWTTRPISELADCAEDWQALHRATSDTPLLDFRLVRDLVSEFATGQELVAIYREKGIPSAMAVLSRINPFYWRTLQPPNAPIGLWLSDQTRNIEGLLRGLIAALGPLCSFVSILQQDPEFVPRPNTSSCLSTLDYIVTPSISVPSSFSAYFQTRSKNFRHDVQRQRNRLERDGIRTRLEFLTESADMERAVGDYSRLECASWKGEINSAVKMDEPQGRFYVKLLRSFSERREAVVYRYFFGDRLVASDLCLRRNATLIILKTAYDEAQKGLSPAHLMRLEAFAEMFDKGGIRRVEFYGPLKDWHTRLTDETRTMYHINYYRWSLLKVLHERRAARRGSVADATGGPGPRERSADAAA